ncbi:MAG: DNA-binding protein [Ignavibacteria bacterium]|nr:DNA-binding protein [Ignavibacteria bacterium]
MNNEKSLVPSLIAEDSLINRIYFIRGEKVMLDFDLAELYETETKQLKRAVKRNIERFPSEFMFELTKEEFLRCQFGTSNKVSQIGASKRGGIRYLHYAFTEHGVAMLSSILKSKRAIEINIAIIKAFVHLRKVANLHKELFDRIENLETGFESLKDLVTSLLIQETKPKINC